MYQYIKEKLINEYQLDIKFSKKSIRRCLLAPNVANKASTYYKSDIRFKIYHQDNTYHRYNIDAEYTFKTFKLLYEYLYRKYGSDKITIISADDKYKINCVG